MDESEGFGKVYLYAPTQTLSWALWRLTPQEGGPGPGSARERRPGGTAFSTALAVSLLLRSHEA